MKQYACLLIMILSFLLAGCGHMNFAPGKAYFASDSQSAAQ